METRSKKRKRRRLISISSNVSSWPNLPARFESLNDDTLTTTLEFVGKKSYKSFGGLNKQCKEIYLASGMTKETFVYGYATLAAIKDKIERADNDPELRVHEAFSKGVVFYNRRDVLDWALQERKRSLLKRICEVAAGEERIGILKEVWGNVEDEDKRDIFNYVDTSAARHGKLNVLKWLETTEFNIKEDMCAIVAARHGQLHILQWLKEERDLELWGGLYVDAIYGGGHLHVIKWLREQKVDWKEWTFRSAARCGNLNILQWLHDEGCPWTEYYRVSEHELKPELINWLRVNGYGNRIQEE